MMSAASSKLLSDLCAMLCTTQAGCAHVSPCTVCQRDALLSVIVRSELMHVETLQAHCKHIVWCMPLMRMPVCSACKIQFKERFFLTCRSIKKFTEAYKQKGYPLHVLLNNAAIQSPKGKRGAKTEDGFEVSC